MIALYVTVASILLYTYFSFGFSVLILITILGYLLLISLLYLYGIMKHNVSRIKVLIMVIICPILLFVCGSHFQTSKVSFRRDNNRKLYENFFSLNDTNDYSKKYFYNNYIERDDCCKSSKRLNQKIDRALTKFTMLYIVPSSLIIQMGIFLYFSLFHLFYNDFVIVVTFYIFLLTILADLIINFVIIKRIKRSNDTRFKMTLFLIYYFQFVTVFRPNLADDISSVYMECLDYDN